MANKTIDSSSRIPPLFPKSTFDDMLCKSQKSNKSNLIEKFSQIDTSKYPDFYAYKKPLEQGLWILLIAKEVLNIKQLTADEISLIIREVEEISVNARSIINSFNRSKDKIHIYDKIHYEIMKPGKEHLLSQGGGGPIEVFYFEPGKPYSSRKLLSADILKNLKGELKIVDPYCGERALDVISKSKNRIKFMTRINNLRPKDKTEFLKVLKDFKTEYNHIEFRDYTCSDIHDRYIISAEALVILGHSIKSLGDKESFAIMLDSHSNKNIYEALHDNFNRRWKSAVIL